MFVLCGWDKVHVIKNKEAVEEILEIVKKNTTKKTRLLICGDTNFCPYGHSTDKRRIKLIQKLITGVNGTYIIPTRPTHKSKSHENSWSHLDGVIAGPGIEISKLEILDDNVS